MSKKLFRLDGRVLTSVAIMLVLLIVAGFRHQIFRFGVEKWISVKYRVEGGWDFDFDRVIFERDRVSFKDVTLASALAGIDCKVDRLDLVVRKISGLRVDIGLDIRTPLVTMQKSGDEAGISLNDLLNSSFGKLKVDIDQGECRLVDGESATEVFFSLISDEKARSLGAFYLSSKSDVKEYANLMIKPYQWPQEFITEFECQDVDLVWLSNVWNFFRPKSEQGWLLKSGLVEGHMWLGLTYDGKLNQTTASMSIKSLSALHADDGLEFAADELDCEFSYPAGKNLAKDIDVWWQSSALKSKILGGRVGCIDPQSHIDFKLTDISGDVNLSSFKDSEISLRGYLDHMGQVSPIVLDGFPSVVDKDTLDVDMKLFLEPEAKCSTHLNLSISVAEENNCIVRGRLKDMGVDQVAMFQHVIGFAYPKVKDFSLKSGKVNCELSLLLKEGHVDKLLLNNLVADELQIYWSSRDILGFCSHLSGTAQLDFNELPNFKFPSWEVNLESGDLIMGRESDQPIGLSDINMQLFMCRDVFEPSWINATYEGIEISADILGYFQEADVKLHLASSVDRLLPFCDSTSRKFDQFTNHLVNLNMQLRRQLGYWDVTGDIELDVKGDWIDQSTFGFQLSDKVLQYRMKRASEIIGESISRGWFKANGVSCEFVKFINDSRGNDFLLEGIVSLDGTFDAKEINFDLTTQYINLFSDFADMRLNCSLDPNIVTTSSGSFSFNTAEKNWTGFFPLYQAQIQEKKLGLLLSDSKADMYIDGNILKFDDVKCESEGVSLEGDVLLDFSAPSGVFLKVVTQNVLGSVKQVENFLHHIPNIKKFEMPFDGRVKGGDDSVTVTYDGRSSEAKTDYEAHLKLMHASYELMDGIEVKDLSLTIDCDSKENETHITNVNGRLGSTYYEGGYNLNGKNIEIYHQNDIDRIVFDIRLENQVMDLVRISGEYDGKSRGVQFDEQASHLFGAKPKATRLVFDDHYKPISVDVAFSVPLEEMFNYHQLLLDFGLLDSTSWQPGFSVGRAKGDVKGRLSLSRDLWKLQLSGTDLALDHLGCENFFLEGEKRGGDFILSELTLDALRVAFDLNKSKGGYEIENLVASSPRSIAHFQKGFLDLTNLNAKLGIDYATIDLAEFGEYSGIVDVKGELGIDLSSKSFGKISLNAMLDSENICDTNMKLTTPKRVNLEYSNELGFQINDSNFLIKNEDVVFAVDVPSLGYLADEKLFHGYRINVCASDEAIDYLEKRFISEEDRDRFSLPKLEKGPTPFLFDFEWSKDRLQIGGLLSEGRYLFRDTVYPINGLSFHYDQSHLDVYIKTPFLDREFGLNFKVFPYDQFETTIEAFELVENEIVNPVKPALFIDCRLKGPEGLSVQKIEGSAFGLDYHFLPQQKLLDQYYLPFLGTIKVDAEKALPICSDVVQEFINELKLKKGYEFRGELTLNKGDWERSFFEGFLQGRDFDLLGYQFKTLLSAVRVDSNAINIRGLKISDDAFTAEVDEMRIQDGGDGDWKLQLPQLMIRDLRPSLLKKRYQSYQRLKPFHVKEMVFQDVEGSVSDLRTLTGKGHLNFMNTFKQGHNLLDIPLEIISRLGLDMVLLVPIQGELEYVLKDGKVVFTKLKNSYSESKRSYFYLWNKTESFVDFEGNMHIDIRMKQYVLLKFTELFVLSINGSLENPRVSLK